MEDDLPPGWIKEFKVRKSAYKSKKDPVYIDPVSGYVFRSKKDVHRYLETGDVNSCAVKPQKRDEVKSLPSSATKRQKLEHPVSRHRPIGGTNAGDGSSNVGSRVFSGAYSLRNRTKTISALTTVPKPITSEISLHRSPSNDNTESKENSNKNGSALLMADDLDRKKEKNMSAGGGFGHLFLESDSRQEQNPDSRIKNKERHSVQNSLSKSKHQKWLDFPHRCSKRVGGYDKKLGDNTGSGTEAVGGYDTNTEKRLTKSKKALNLPVRASKRLAGVEPEPLVNSAVIAQTLPKAVRPPDDETAQAVDMNNPSNESQGCDLSVHLLAIDDFESSQVKINEADNLLALTPESNKKQENCLKSKKRHNSQVRKENNSSASGKKKEFDMPHRSSKQLACIDSVTSMSFLGIDASWHEEANREDALYSDPLEARGKRITFNTEQLKILERNFELGSHPKPQRRMELARALGVQPRQVQFWFQNRRARLKKEQIEKDHDHLRGQFEAIQAEYRNLHSEAESGLETRSPLHGELLYENRSFGYSMDKLERAEVSQNHDRKSESQFIPPLGEILSDPCLEFAFKTLTGDLPVEATSIDEPVSNDIIGERNLTTRHMGRSIKGEAPISSKTTKKLSLPHEALEFQPETVARMSNFESPNRRQYFDNHITSVEHLQVEQVSDKPKQLPFVSFDHWSDPSFDSAFKTLTASARVKSCFEQQVKPSHIQMEGSLTLPDFRLPNLFQTDISSIQFDSSEKRLSSQPPMNKQSFLFSGSLSFSSGHDIQSQPPSPPVVKKNQTPPHMKRNRGRPRKVNS